MTKGSGTRSGMLWEVERILKECDTLPNILLMENVPQIHSQENKDDFILWQKELEKLGYRNYWEDLNAKDYLVPQNRNRTFMISILGDYFYEFPQKQKLVLRLKDLLESEVDEKYFLSDKMINFFKENSRKNEEVGNGFRFKPINEKESLIAKTITTRAGSRMDDNFIIDKYNKALSETLLNNEIHEGFVDAYNRNIRNDNLSGCITTRVNASNESYVILKKELCNKLIEEGKVQEGDIVKHSYTSQILEGNKKCVEKSDGVMITLTTRGDCVGVCVKDTEPKVIVKGNYSPSNHNASRIVDDNGIAPTVMENHGTITAIVESGGVMIPEATQKGYAIANDGDGVYINRPHQKRGVVQKGMIQTLKTQCNDIGVVVNNDTPQLIGGIGEKNSNGENDRAVVVNDNNIYNLFFTIFDLCCAIDTKEKDKYERSRELLQILWQEIGKKEIWQEIRRFISVQEKKILQSNLYENGIYENRKSQSRISSSPSNSKKHNGSITNREKMFNMWEEWKTRYTPQRWELSKQQFRQFNLFMQELSYETTQGETSMQDMWKTNDRFRVLQQTLFEIQEIWRPIENKISNGLRIRKLSPLECWRLMGVKDEDYEKIKPNQSESSLYHLAGDSLITTIIMELIGTMVERPIKKYNFKEWIKN